jgi:acetamidase/formamidase
MAIAAAIPALLVVGPLPSQISLAQRPVATSAPSIVGVWALWRGRFDNEQWTRLRVERDGDTLRASTSGGLRLTGVSTGDRVTMRSKSPSVLIEAQWQGDSLVGTSVEGERTWMVRVVRERERPASIPTRQSFKPTQFSSIFSSTVPAVMRIWPGDTIRTETGGKNAIYNFGNPLTGPFFIEGALPGDVLVVHLLRVRINQGSAKSGTVLNWRAVPGFYFGTRDANASDANDGKWVLDTVAGVARLENPSDGLRNYTVPLRPMLGCIGVAPGRGESHHGGELGYWGGNMDYNRMVEGATVHLQISQPGALLYIGDGHAAQGDGEVVGQGLETSMDVEFSVELVRDKSIATPRIEDNQYIMSAGIAGSLDEALQRATAGMAGWLESEYRLTRSEVALVLGTAGQYDVAEIVDGGTFNVIARLSKERLRGVTVRAPRTSP